jgi:hypothetical protein
MFENSFWAIVHFPFFNYISETGRIADRQLTKVDRLFTIVDVVRRGFSGFRRPGMNPAYRRSGFVRSAAKSILHGAKSGSPAVLPLSPEAKSTGGAAIPTFDETKPIDITAKPICFAVMST